MSAMEIAVIGLQTHDGVKTTPCKALIHGFKKSNASLVPFKPHSGKAIGTISAPSRMDYPEASCSPVTSWN